MLDGLRGAGVLVVMFMHGLAAVSTITGVLRPFTFFAETMVALFFGMSGFLIYRPFVRARLQGRAVPARGRFWLRRATRLFPAYWIALTLLSVWPGLLGPFTGDWWQFYSLGYLYTPAQVHGGIGPAWTLGAEIGYYALLPLYAWLWHRRRERWTVRGELQMLGAFALASIVFRVAVVDVHREYLFASLLGCGLWIAAGMCVAVLYAAWENGDQNVLSRLGGSPWRWWGAAVLAYVIGMAVINPRAPLSFDGPQTGLEWGVYYTVTGLCELLILVSCVVAAPSAAPRLQRTLASRPMAAVAAISYGIYLWHAPLFAGLQELRSGRLPGLPGDAMVIAAGSAGAFAFAWLSWHGVEKRLLAATERWRLPTEARIRPGGVRPSATTAHAERPSAS